MDVGYVSNAVVNAYHQTSAATKNVKTESKANRTGFSDSAAVYEKAQTLLDAFDKGFKEATKTWGKELPDVSQQTYTAVHGKFQNWMDGTEK